MNCYIKSESGSGVVAVRASRAAVKNASPSAVFVEATAELRGMARRGTIPTLRITADGHLGYL